MTAAALTKAEHTDELKADGNNHKELVAAAVKAMEGYEGPYCMESFDPRCVRWLRKNRPHILRGQLVENFVKRDVPAPWILRVLLTRQLMNFLIRPDFIAFRFSDRKTLENFICRRFWKLAGVSWTLDSPEDFQTAEKEGWIPIFEGFRPD